MTVSPLKILVPALAALLAVAAPPRANAQAQQPDAHPALYLGAAWYPEQWPESR